MQRAVWSGIFGIYEKSQALSLNDVGWQDGFNGLIHNCLTNTREQTNLEPIIFMFCLTLHNIEEALWLSDWMAKTMPSRKQTAKEHFIFAVIGITILGYLAAGLHTLYPNSQYFEFIFIGFVGSMLINAVVPHLILSIKYRKYCPGAFTGCFLIIPIHLIILSNAVNSHLKTSEIIIATLAVGVVLLGAIPALKGLARRVLDVKQG